MTDLHAHVVAERAALAETLDALSPEQWATPSLCAGWTVRDVAAHLIWPHEHGTAKMFLNFVKSGFNVEKFTTTTAHGDTRSGAAIAAAWHNVFDSRWTPPGGYGSLAPLTDTIAHGQDIRRPLGLSAAFLPERITTVLDFLTTKKATSGFTKKGRLDGLALEATDIGWAAGSGADVRGNGEALMMAMLGRRAVLDELEGDGVALLRSRL